MHQIKIFLMIFPLVLLLVVHLLSSENKERVPLFISLPEKESFHRVGGSPVGVGILLVFLTIVLCKNVGSLCLVEDKGFFVLEMVVRK